MEAAIHQHFIPALTGHEACSVVERELLALPVRLGGMGLVNPMSESTHAFEASKRITAPLVALIVAQTPNQALQRNELLKEKNRIKNRIKKSRRELQEQCAQDIHGQLNPQLQRSVELAQEKHGSRFCRWLNMGFFYTRGIFVMRYVYGMDGTSEIHPFYAIVAPPSRWIML